MNATRTVVRKTNYTIVIVENNNAEQITNFTQDIGNYVGFDLSKNRIKAGNNITYSFQVVSNELEMFFRYLYKNYRDLNACLVRTIKGGSLSQYVYTPNGVEQISG